MADQAGGGGVCLEAAALAAHAGEGRRARGEHVVAEVAWLGLGLGLGSGSGLGLGLGLGLAEVTGVGGAALEEGAALCWRWVVHQRAAYAGALVRVRVGARVRGRASDRPRVG